MTLAGSYDMTVKSPMGDQRSTLKIVFNGATFSGTNDGAGGPQDVAGTIDGNTLIWRQKVTTPVATTLDMSATVDGDVISGTVQAGVFGAFPMTGKRIG